MHARMNTLIGMSRYPRYGAIIQPCNGRDSRQHWLYNRSSGWLRTALDGVRLRPGTAGRLQIALVRSEPQLQLTQSLSLASDLGIFPTPAVDEAEGSTAVALPRYNLPAQVT